VILPVPDIAQAARFYARVLRAPGERISEGRHYFDCGGTILALYSPREDGDALGKGWRFHASQYVYLAIPDLAAAYRRVQAAGGRVEGPIERMPWGERMFWARDPFGSPISFVDEDSVFTGWAPGERGA
jgi:uncharacterized glyoxalase superfamily protein PhnB